MRSPASLEAWIGLGSNLGDREAHLRRAVERLAGLGILGRTSSLYETDPWGVPGQPPYLNAVVSLAPAAADPRAFLAQLQRIEREAGRVPGPRWGPRWGPRPLDLDLLFWGDLRLKSADLTLPHPEIPGRRFVLVPLAEVAPDLIHPDSGLIISRLLELCPDSGAVRLWGRPDRLRHPDPT
ncbi:MAG: 2-amino-4-hydroxy-6-hydroxymethyldihydropteridine diphosphokinase [Candidatus Zixiibacteriota bacterium]|nr:MAG: 2-amino-4-hydroxy-6-hydroxymethyldihydropteridine diphosphokinase [candidate division Zixibacteria bacterium]